MTASASFQEIINPENYNYYYLSECVKVLVTAYLIAHTAATEPQTPACCCVCWDVSRTMSLRMVFMLLSWSCKKDRPSPHSRVE